MKEKILNDPTQDAKLKAFIAYCKANPDQRYWQAIRNTSPYSIIYGSDGYVNPFTPEFQRLNIKFEDTFYL